MATALDSVANGPGSSPGQGHCVVFLQDSCLSQSLSTLRCINRYQRIAKGSPAMD